MNSLALSTSERQSIRRCLAAEPYDLARAQQDYPWMGDEVDQQVAGLPAELSAFIQHCVLEEFANLAEVLGVGSEVEISSIRCRGGDCGIEIEIRMSEGLEVSPCAEDLLADFPRWVEQTSARRCPVIMAMGRRTTTREREKRMLWLTKPGEYASKRLDYLMSCQEERYRCLCDSGKLTDHLEGMDEYCRSEELKAAEWKAEQIREKDPFLEENDPRSFRGLVNNAIRTRSQELMREVVMA